MATKALSRFASLMRAGAKGSILLGGTGATPNLGDFTVNRNLPSVRFAGSRRDFESEVGVPWDNSVVRAALRWLVDTFSEADRIVTRPESDGVRKAQLKHPSLEWLSDPSPERGDDLYAGVIPSLIWDGNAYAWKHRDKGGRLLGLYYLPHWLVEPKPGERAEVQQPAAYYEYKTPYGPSLKLDPSEVVHYRDGSDPLNPLKGLSRLKAALRSVYTLNEAENYSAALLGDKGVPAGILAPKTTGAQDFEPLTPDEEAALKAKVREGLSGDGRGDYLIWHTPLDMIQPGLTPEQLALDKLQSIPMHYVLACIGVDPMVLGLPSSNKTYSNQEEARRGSYQEAVLPLHRTVDGTETRQVLRTEFAGDPMDRLERDYTRVRCLQEDTSKLYDRVTKAVAGGILTPDEGRDLLGYPNRGGVADELLRPRNTTLATEADNADPNAQPPAINEELAQAAKALQRVALAHMRG